MILQGLTCAMPFGAFLGSLRLKEVRRAELRLPHLAHFMGRQDPAATETWQEQWRLFAGVVGIR